MSGGTLKPKRKLTDEDIIKMQKLVGQGMNVSKIAMEIDVRRPTRVKYVKKAEESRIQI